MSDNLTQKEVDAVLRGSAGESTAIATEIVPYNFVRPSRVSKERQATLEAVYARFAAALQALLTTRLRTPMDVTISSVEQLVFSEFVLSLASPCSSFVCRLNDRSGSFGVLDTGSELGFLIVDRMFGGVGDTQVPRRAHTALEQGVIRGVAERAIGLLRDTWQGTVPMNPEITHFESNPAMLQIAGREDNVLVVNLTVRTDRFSSSMTVCLPMAAFETFLQEQNVRSGSAHAEHGTHRQTIGTVLQPARVTVRVRLPLFTLNARTVAALEPGQTIQSGHPVDVPVEVHVNGRLQYLGILGQIRHYIGVRLAQSASAPPAERPVLSREGRML
jgi:flagellar motor switch protein FliM